MRGAVRATAAIVTLALASHAAAQTVAPVPAATPITGHVLPLHVPIRAVMAGIIDFSAFGVEKAAHATEPLNDKDWLSVGLAALNLVGASTLITLPGTGPNDATWVADPEWTKWAADMQTSATNVAIAVRRQDRAALNLAAADLGAACQSCHSQFRDASPGSGDTRLAAQ
ncbi:MAG: hypothetical protein GC155_18575 [Alphaproteobacteria bacterium]|nr:hypothetical protein [Alphaproteobacteria bacterium]